MIKNFLLAVTLIASFSCVHHGPSEQQSNSNRDVAMAPPKYTRLNFFQQFFDYLKASQNGQEVSLNSVLVFQDKIQITYGSNSLSTFSFAVSQHKPGGPIKEYSDYKFREIQTSTAGNKSDWPTIASAELMELITADTQYATSGFVVAQSGKKISVKLVELSDTPVQTKSGTVAYFPMAAGSDETATAFYKYSTPAIVYKSSTKANDDIPNASELAEALMEQYCVNRDVLFKKYNQEQTPENLADFKKTMGDQRKAASDFFKIKDQASIAKYEKAHSGFTFKMMCNMLLAGKIDMKNPECYDVNNKKTKSTPFIQKSCH